MTKLADLVRTVAAGTILFRDGDQGSEMFVIQSGRVRIFTETEGQQKLLAVLGAGDFFGEMAILNEKPRTATAEVLEDAALLAIGPDMLASMLKHNAEIAVRLVKALAQRLDSANTLIDLLMHRDTKARVILGLTREAEFHGAIREGDIVVLSMTDKQLAEQLDVDHSEVDSVLRRLSRLGIVEVQPTVIRLIDVPRLHEFLAFISGERKADL